MPEEGQLHDAKPSQGRQPKPAPQIPVGLRKIFGPVPLALFQYQHFVALFRKPQRAYRTSESTANDDVVIIVLHPASLPKGILKTNRVH